ncbi:MAG: 3'-5' exonuclease, partial [Weeksellaceae bacterium]|nr:3'-5' exonuclease [Weeksellaceae bacterium]
KILNSAETEELIYVLEAMLDGKRSTINRALKSSFVNWSTEKILKLDEEEAVKKFKEYNESWQKNGIYTTLMNFSKDFEIRSYLLSEKANKGERIITNFYHLAEVLYKIESRQHLKPVELTDWLKKNKAKDQSSSDEMVQRIENDENAVNITTIHSSKGLQYSIVLAPDLDMRYESRYSIINLRKNDGNYITAKRNQLTEEEIDEHKKQEEQENRRLIYVALTRAVYTCFLYRNTRYKNTSLSFFTDEVRDNPLISTIESAENQGYYISNKQVNIQHKRVVKNFKLKENAWQQMSYSGLSAHLALPSKENYTETEENYDRFIFKDLRKGAQTGNFLHFIFENLNFSNPDTWQYAIDKAISRFIPAKKEDEKFQRNIHIFLNHVMNAELPTYWESFKLSSLYSNKMLHELEFDFPVSLFSPKQLENLRNYGILVSNYYLDKEIEGMMTGFIDLFFEYKGKYYVLDWKSNYLGPALEDYSRKNLEKAMNENNYHLQYLIYSLAVKKYLKSRLGEEFDFDKKFGGVFYLFVRGMRENTDFGVYHYRPDFSVLQKLEQNVK